MATLLKWNAENLNNVYQFKIEKGSSIDGPFSELNTLDSLIFEYEDLTGTEDSWYRIIIKLVLIKKNELVTFDVADKTLGNLPLHPFNDSIRIFVNGVLCSNGIDYTVDFSTGIITCNNTISFPIGSEASIDYKYLEETEPTSAKHAIVLPMCKIYGYLSTPDGSPILGEIIYIRTYNPPQSVNPKTLSTLAVEVKTDSDGYFETMLLQNSVINAKCRRLGLDLDAVIPTEDKIEFNTLFNI